MASITTLPNEITDVILNDLPSDSTLSLSKTCKRLYKATLPRIYRDISMQWTGLAPDRTTPRRPKIERLLYALISKPELARMVRTIQFRARDCVFWRDDGAVQLSVQFSDVYISAEEKRLYKRIIDAFSLPLPQTEHWKRELSGESNLYVIMMLVISQCTHLESMSTSIVFLLQGDWLKDLVRHALRSTQEAQQLRKLAHVEVTSDAHGEDWRTEPLCLKETLLHLLYLPNMSTLDLTAITDASDLYHHSRQISNTNFWPLDNIPTARNFTALHLRRSEISLNTLEGLLAQTPKLRELRYDCFKPFSSGKLDLTTLRAGLEHVRSTLTHLTVRCEMYIDEDGDGIEEIESVTSGRLGSLQDFTELTTLSVSCAVLFGESDVTPGHEWQLASVLPLRLQKLTIYDDLWGFDSFGLPEGVPRLTMFEEFFKGGTLGSTTAFSQTPRVQQTKLKHFRSATPALTTFVFDIRNRIWALAGYWKYSDASSHLVHMCESEGVSCTILHDGKIKKRRLALYSDR
jgi:hypothetical protein